MNQQYQEFKSQMFHNVLHLISLSIIFYLSAQLLIITLSNLKLEHLTLFFIFIHWFVMFKIIKKEISNRNNLIYNFIQESYSQNYDVKILKNIILDYPIHYCKKMIELRTTNPKMALYIVTEDQMVKIMDLFKELNIDPLKATKQTSFWTDQKIFSIITKTIAK